MSRFICDKLKNLEAYVPGEQPKDTINIKLNTNESPFPPSKAVIDSINEASTLLQLYPDPECSVLKSKAAKLFGVSPENIFCGNGSDEVLNFAFLAFCDENKGMSFPSISYGFYPVFGDLYGIDYKKIPLCDDFSINAADYHGLSTNIVIANPNAPTGLCLSAYEVRSILDTNKDNLVIIDEAYVDFGAETCIPLIKEYDNLLVVHTFSKSHSLAGARLGFGIACPEIIEDLEKIKYSTNPYNINRSTMAAGIAAIDDNDYYMNNCKTVIKAREYTTAELRKLGFCVIESKANFVFARHQTISGEEIYTMLRQNGILVRHFSSEIIKDFNRISIGSPDQMEVLINTLKKLLLNQGG
ncbi:MAG: histidinol-phosphate transaminase [Clostridia bacterium]|nr:histidinol-phosphate transaminase [Clostridia bacterium]